MNKYQEFRHAHPRLFLLIFILLGLVIAIIIFILLRSSTSEQDPFSPSTTIGTLPEPSTETPSETPAEQPSSQPAQPAANPYNQPNCTTAWGELTLINPVFTVDTNYIAKRKSELINLTATYDIRESGSNGTPHMDPVAAERLNAMLNDYKSTYPGHEMTTRSCFRQRGTTCGRLCAKTGTSDHHTGYTCDLIDSSYGTELNTDLYASHPEWQWLKANSYKYGFIDRFPEAFAGSSMSEPVNINENGSTGLYETWHYRYVGISAATEIATGKYNNGAYDSLEHYLKSTGHLTSLTSMSASCPSP